MIAYFASQLGPNSTIEEAIDEVYRQAWSRVGEDGPKAIYNGIEWEEWPDAPATPPALLTTSVPLVIDKPECYSLSEDQYVLKDMTITAVEEFCANLLYPPGQDADGNMVLDPNTESLWYLAFPGTQDESMLQIQFKPGSKVPYNQETCVGVFRDVLLNGCVGDNDDVNPLGWAAGGQYTTEQNNTAVTYSIKPSRDRGPIPHIATAQCQWTWDTKFNDANQPLASLAVYSNGWWMNDTEWQLLWTSMPDLSDGSAITQFVDSASWSVGTQGWEVQMGVDFIQEPGLDKFVEKILFNLPGYPNVNPCTSSGVAPSQEQGTPQQETIAGGFLNSRDIIDSFST